MKKTYFIAMPKTITNAIVRELKLSNPPNITDVETVSIWCIAQLLSSDCFFDYKHVYKDDTNGILEVIREETKGYLKELEEKR